MKKLATIAFIILSHTSFAQLDSLKRALPLDTLSLLTNKLDSIESSARGRIDSVTQYYQQATGKIEGLSSRYQQKIDSLGKLKLPTDKYSKKLDSLNNLMAETTHKVEEKIQSIKQKATEKLNAIPLPPELQPKVTELTSSLDKIQMPALGSEIKSPIDLGNLNTSLDQVIPSTDLKGISGELPSLGSVSDVTKDIGSVSDLTQGVSEKAGTLQQGASQITQAGGQVNQLDQLAESQAMKLDGVKDLKDAAGNATTNLMPSEDEAKQQVLQQVQSVAVDHFAGKQEVLQAAMDKLAKYKTKYESLPSIDNLPKRFFSDMKGKPFRDRIVPGVQFQFLGKQGNLLVDFNAYAGFRLTSKLTSGMGWNQRVAYNTRLDEFNAKARIFGPRAFAEYNLPKGFMPRMEVEVMNSAIPPFSSTVAVDSRSREWVVSSFIGMKKEYRFIKNVRGTTTVMLNAFHPRNKNLYGDIVNVRFGFEFPMKKKIVSTP